jgi:hypothetical protein
VPILSMLPEYNQFQTIEAVQHGRDEAPGR